MQGWPRVLVLFAACVALSADQAQALTPQLSNPIERMAMAGETDDGVWEPFIGSDLRTYALPDYHANYFAFTFDRTQGDNRYIGLRITGAFGYTRYMSYNVYDANEGTSYGALTDFQIEPLPGNVNPFRPGSDAQAQNRQYTITVVPNGDPTDSQQNVLTFPDDQVTVQTVILRYYVPQGSETANVPLPTIEAFDVRTGDGVPRPQPQSVRPPGGPIIFAQRLRPIFQTVVDNTLRFYRAAGAGQFNNADNLYVINAVEKRPGEVLVLRLKPPTFPRSNGEYGETEVRYWSINQGNSLTSTPFGVIDADFSVARDGFVYIVMGDQSIRRVAEERGYNFMPWKVRTPKAVILYRNMLTDPNFPGTIENVPPLDLSDPQNIYRLDAKNYIGDYAPTGEKVSRADFLSNRVGEELVPPRD